MWNNTAPTKPYGSLTFEHCCTMSLPYHIDTFSFSGKVVKACIPDREFIQKRYLAEKAAGGDPGFPYWAQPWPAALALCELIGANPSLVNDKTVLELAAGSGLPSLLSAATARSVFTTDYLPEAVALLEKSVQYNGLANTKTGMLNWHQLPAGLAAEVLLLSDVNYAPENFDSLHALLGRFVNNGTLILLSTPQRLAGKAFLNSVAHWCRRQHYYEMQHQEQLIPVSVWELGG